MRARRRVDPAAFHFAGVVRMSDAALRFDRVSFRYGDEPWALKDVSFSLSGGEWLVLMGASGSGKSTVARLACRLLTPTAGTVTAASVGYVAQDPQANIVGETVGEDVAFAIRGKEAIGRDVDERVLGALRAVGMEWAVHETDGDAERGRAAEASRSQRRWPAAPGSW